VFLDGVRTHHTNLVGALNRGWTVAKSLLGFERIFLGSPKLPEYGLQVLETLARARGVLDDPVFNDRFVSLKLDVAHLATSTATMRRSSDAASRSARTCRC
jgi:alkylation response protein AidB-like acyl-CoA dehydrogenase